MRTITLTLNTLSVTWWIKLKWCHFFDIFDTVNGVTEIPLLQINPQEYICKKNNSIQVFTPEWLPSGNYIWFSSGKDFTDTKTFIEYEENTEQIVWFLGKKMLKIKLVPYISNHLI